MAGNGRARPKFARPIPSRGSPHAGTSGYPGVPKRPRRTQTATRRVVPDRAFRLSREAICLKAAAKHAVPFGL
jgi:hypothetical protein